MVKKSVLISATIIGLTIIGGSSASAQSSEGKPRTRDRPAATQPAEKDKSAPEGSSVQERAWETLEYLVTLASNLKEPETRALGLAAIGSSMALKDQARGLELLKSAYLSLDRILDAKKQGPIDARAQAELKERVENLRAEILRQISMIDGAAGAQLSGRTQPEVAGTQMASGDRSRRNLAVQYEQSRALMQAAYELLPTDPARAMYLAQQTLVFGIPGWLSDFLTQLRQRQPGLADELYESAFNMITQGNQPSADGLVVLAGYVFPGYFGDGRVREGINTVRAQRFLGAMAAGLAAPRALEGNPDPQRNYQALRQYVMIQRLMPLFQQFRPDLVASLRTLLENASRASDEFRPKLEAQPVNPSPDNFTPSLLEEAERAPNAQERDAILAQAALSLAEQGEFEAARQIVLRIANPRLREATLEKAADTSTLAAVNKGDLERARTTAGLVKDPSRRVDLLTLVGSRLVQEGENDRAAIVLTEAQGLIRPMDPNVEKVRLLFGVGGAYLRVDEGRAMELFQSSVGVINRLSEQIVAPNSSAAAHSPGGGDARALRQLLDASFGLWARASFDSALMVSSGLKNAVYRIVAQAAICRPVLAKLSGLGRRSKSAGAQSKPSGPQGH